MYKGFDLLELFPISGLVLPEGELSLVRYSELLNIGDQPTIKVNTNLAAWAVVQGTETNEIRVSAYTFPGLKTQIKVGIGYKSGEEREVIRVSAMPLYFNQNEGTVRDDGTKVTPVFRGKIEPEPEVFISLWVPYRSSVDAYDVARLRTPGIIGKVENTFSCLVPDHEKIF